MKVNLVYVGLYSGNYYKKELDLPDTDALGSLKHALEINFSKINQSDNSYDTLRFCDGVRSNRDVFKYLMFECGKISEMAHLVAIEEE